MALDPHRALTQYVHRIWQTQQGLPEATVTCIRQTHDGYIWLGTRSGLVRFDGVHFTAIRDQGIKKLEDAWIQDLQEDADHNLWLATDGDGLIRLQGDDASQFGKAQGLPSENVRCVLIDRRGEVWAGTDAGLARLVGDTFKDLTGQEGLPRFDVHAICQDTAGSIWVGGDRGQLCCWSGKEFSSRTPAAVSTHDTIHALACSQEGVVWVGASSGLVRLDRGQERRVLHTDGLAKDVVLCLTEGRDHGLWIGTKDGFSRLRGDDIENFGTADGLSQSTVYAICEDREGSLWVGTKHGLNQFVDRRTIPFTMSEGLPSNNTGPVFEDRSGAIWVGTLDAGLARFDGRRFSAVKTEPPVSKSIYALAGSPEGDLWIGTDRGLWRLHGEAIVERLTTQQGLPSDVVLCLCPDSKGTLWVGTTSGLGILRDGKIEPISAGEVPNNLPCLALVDCGQFLLVAAEGRGLLRCENGKLDRFPLVDDSLAGVDAFYRDAEGLLWMGTRGAGLLLLDGDRTFRFTSKDGLYDDDIFGIAADDQDRLWMACSKGIFFVARDDLRKFASGELKHLTTTAFTPLDALRTIECQEGVQPAVQKTQDGRIWFSTIRGLVVVDPSLLVRRLPPTPVVIEKMVVDGENVNPRRVQSIGPGKANVSFQYAALSFASPSRITFRYKLNGFDKDWVDADNRREAFYTNLAPGKYSFAVVAKNVDDKEYETIGPVSFVIAPRFYQTPWFWPLCGALLLFAAWSGYRLRVRQIRARLNVIVTERSRIARELHDTLMQGFAGVTMEMQALASQLPASADKSTLDDIIHDAGNCLREARRSVAGLRGDRSGLAASLAQAARQLTETSDVRLTLQLSDASSQISTDAEYNLLRIAHEAISNSLKHSAARHIEVTLIQDTDELRLTIKDDGAGFRALDEPAAHAGHYGLIGMRERAEHTGADFHLESEPGRGTSIRVVLPLISFNSKAMG